MMNPENNEENNDHKDKATKDQLGENTGRDTMLSKDEKQDAQDANPEHSNKNQGPSGEDL
jgi:hypothetical protein